MGNSNSLNINTNTSLPNPVSPILLEAVKFDKTYTPVPIVESGEKLVDIEEILSSQSQVIFNQSLTSTGQKRIFVLRQALIKPLLSVAKEFNSLGYKLRFEYVYRRLEDQRRMYEQSVADTIKQYPSLSKEKIIEIAGILVASTPDTAAHVSGAAVDVTLLTLDNQVVNLGAEYLQSGDKSATNCLDISDEAKKNRQLLCSVMDKYDFANYPYEFWHFCQGDKIEAKVHGKDHAIYGPLIFDPETKMATPVSNAEKPFDVEHLFINFNNSN